MKQYISANHNEVIAEKASCDACESFSHPMQKKINESPRQRVQQKRMNQLRDVSKANRSNGLPSQLRAGIESLSGMDMSDVVVHRNSAKPAQLNALAYAQGNQIHLGPGQERHLPHEAWHVVQQAHGRVRPTLQMQDGVPINDSADLEHEADIMGARAASLGTVQAKPGYESSSISGQKSNLSVVQRAVNTSYGTFTDTIYKLKTKKLEALIKFTPNDKVEAGKIGMIQSIKSTKDGSQAFKEPAMEARVSDEGTNIDRLAEMNNPVYGAPELANDKGLEETAMTNAATYKLGYRKKSNNGSSWDVQDAELYDAPTLGNLGNNGGKVFETTALILEGADKGAYLGSVSWGATSNGAGVVTKAAFAKASDGEPTSGFMKAAEMWNRSKARGAMVVKNDGTPTKTSGVTLAKDTELDWLGNTGSGGKSYVNGRVKGGTHIGKEVKVEVQYLKDKGDGKDHKPLPDADATRVKNFNVILHSMKTVLDQDKSVEEGKPVPEKLRTDMQKEFGDLRRIWKTLSSTSKEKMKASTTLVIDQYYLKVNRRSPSQSVMWSDFES